MVPRVLPEVVPRDVPRDVPGDFLFLKWVREKSVGTVRVGAFWGKNRSVGTPRGGSVGTGWGEISGHTRVGANS